MEASGGQATQNTRHHNFRKWWHMHIPVMCRVRLMDILLKISTQKGSDNILGVSISSGSKGRAWRSASISGMNTASMIRCKSWNRYRSVSSTRGSRTYNKYI